MTEEQFYKLNKTDMYITLRELKKKYFKYLKITTINQVVEKFIVGFKPNNLKEYLTSLDEIDKHRFMEEERVIKDFYDKHQDIVKQNESFAEYTEWYLEKHKNEYEEWNRRSKKVLEDYETGLTNNN